MHSNILSRQSSKYESRSRETRSLRFYQLLPINGKSGSKVEHVSTFSESDEPSENIRLN